MAWDPSPAGYEFVQQNVYSLWRGTVVGGGFGPLTNPAEHYCLVTCNGNGNNGSCAKRDSQQNPIESGTHALHPSLSLPDDEGKHRAQNAQTTTRTPQGLLWVFFIHWVTVPRTEKWLEYP